MELVILPSALIANIMTAIYHVDPDIKYRLLNKQVYKETAQAFYDKYNNHSISKFEYRHYINTTPLKFGYLALTSKFTSHNYQYDVSVNYCSLPIFKPSEYNVLNSQLTITNYLTKYVYMVQCAHTRKVSFETLKDNLEYDIENYDLLTKYTIYKNRTNCMMVNPYYAKQKILNHMHDYKNIRTESFLPIYCYYQYLILNCFIFNLMDKAYDLIPYIQFYYVSNMSETKEDVNRMLDNPIDVDIYNQQKIIMLNEIDRLEVKIIDYIHKNL